MFLKPAMPRRHRISALMMISALFFCATAQAGIRIATWKTKHLGWDNEKDFAAMARVISRFDIIGLQEVMHANAAKKLARIVHKQTGEKWGVITSRAIGDGRYKEGYAFLWRQAAVSFQGGAVVYLDLGNQFIRQPFSARFQDKESEDGAYVLSTVHIIYGDSRSDRMPEIRALSDYWRWLGESFKGDHRILMGDFNMPPTRPSWRALRSLASPAITHGRSTLSREGQNYVHLYDNIWTERQLHPTSTGVLDYPPLLGLSHHDAYRHVSDHAPVYITLGNVTVDTRPFNALSTPGD